MTQLYFYNVHKCESVAEDDWEEDGNCWWDMSLEEFQEAYNAGDSSYFPDEHGLQFTYFFLTPEARQTHCFREFVWKVDT